MMVNTSSLGVVPALPDRRFFQPVSHCAPSQLLFSGGGPYHRVGPGGGRYRKTRRGVYHVRLNCTLDTQEGSGCTFFTS